jgi:hypothetical protein
MDKKKGRKSKQAATDESGWAREEKGDLLRQEKPAGQGIELRRQTNGRLVAVLYTGTASLDSLVVSSNNTYLYRHCRMQGRQVATRVWLLSRLPCPSAHPRSLPPC